MAKPQITIRWNSSMGLEYEQSRLALESYDPMPEIKAAISIKGVLPDNVLRQIIMFAEDANPDTEIGVTLTATWDEEAPPNQLRLFSPGPSYVTDEGEIRDRSTVTVKSGGRSVTMTGEEFEDAADNIADHLGGTLEEMVRRDTQDDGYAAQE